MPLLNRWHIPAKEESLKNSKWFSHSDALLKNSLLNHNSNIYKYLAGFGSFGQNETTGNSDSFSVIVLIKVFVSYLKYSIMFETTK